MKEDLQNKVEVCFSPALYRYFKNPQAIVVVVDILRASSAICAAFMNGADKIIPVGTLREARRYKRNGYLVAAERNGIVRNFADFGNSPFNFTPEMVQNHTVVYSTTNGTRAIHMAASGHQALVGSFLNISALAEYLHAQKRDIVILCAGWKNKFNLEDTLFAGALADKLLGDKDYNTICDSTLASIDLWSMAKHNTLNYIEKIAQRHRLKKNGLDDVIEFCHTPDLTRIIPVFHKGELLKLKDSPSIVN